VFVEWIVRGLDASSIVMMNTVLLTWPLSL
jgi:hypothetical protein